MSRRGSWPSCVGVGRPPVAVAEVRALGRRRSSAVFCWSPASTGRAAVAGGRSGGGQRLARPGRAPPDPRRLDLVPDASAARRPANGREAAGLGRAPNPGAQPPPRRAAGRRGSASPPGAPAWLFLPLGVGAAVRSLPLAQGSRAALAHSWSVPALASWPSDGWSPRSRPRRCTAGGRRAASSWSLLPAGDPPRWPGCSSERPRLRPPFLAAAALGVATWCVDDGRGGHPSSARWWWTSEPATNPGTGCGGWPCPTGARLPSVDELLLVGWAAALVALLAGRASAGRTGRHPPARLRPRTPSPSWRAGARAAGLLERRSGSPRSDPDGRTSCRVS